MSPVWTPPQPSGPTITATQSYTWVLREAFLSALQRLPYFQNFKVRRNPHPGPIQEQDLPLLGVYMLPDELMTPDSSDGMGNASAITFIDNARIHFSVIVVNNDPDAAEKEIDEAYWAICNGLWRDQYLTGYANTYNPHLTYGTLDNTLFEAITRAVRRHRFGNAGDNNSLPIAELQYEVSIRYRDEFAPVILDDLLRIHGDAFPGRYGLDPNAVQHAIYEIDFGPPPATTIALVSSANPSTLGQKIILTATVTGNKPTGTVAFMDGVRQIGLMDVNYAGHASYTIEPTQGKHSLTAVYSGDQNNASSTSSALTQTVN